MLLWINGPFGGGKTQTAHELQRRLPGSVICDPEYVGYFDEMVTRLRGRGHDVRHFALLADRHTILRRLRERGFGHALHWVGGRWRPGRDTFAVANVDRCLERLRRPEFGEHIWTEDRTIPEIADQIAVSAGLQLSPNTDGAFRARCRLAWTGIKHIRVD